ncbi:MAG: hypothetical protein LBI79_10530 [Nitrososphaerota archaeon]|nr:hypothetical protein [Nitrososphaerota archaeon]
MSTTIEIKTIAHKCERCGYLSISRISNPRRCPRCQHAYGAPIRKPFVRVDNYGTNTTE